MTLEELIRRLRNFYDIKINEVETNRDYVLYAIQYNGEDVVAEFGYETMEICDGRFESLWKHFNQNASEIEVRGIELDNDSEEITISVTRLNAK